MNSLQKLLDFLSRLDAASIHFDLARHRDEAIMVLIAVPGERWEAEFFADGHVEVEVFRNAGANTELQGEDALEQLFRDHTD
jgi:hypothetical protein